MNPDHASLAPEPHRPDLVRPLVLFLATVACVFHAGAMKQLEYSGLGNLPGFVEGLLDPHFMREGAAFAVPLLGILLTHEFGHFFAARYHGVPASLPHFIPLPLGMGTFGAVIGMHGRIRSRNALLDIGASGPLAGLLVAIPVLAYGLMHSRIEALPPTGYIQEGQSLLYVAMKRWLLGPIPAGHDVFLHPTAHAGWAGILITMINLIPVGQLDGGHVAYALFGERYNEAARWVHRSLLLMWAGNVVFFIAYVLEKVLDGSIPWSFSTAAIIVFGNSSFWLLWFGLLAGMGKLSGSFDHPPVDPGELSFGRRAIAWICVAVFVLLFMPTPFAQY